MNKGKVMWLADESDFSLSDAETFEERKLFVENLGWLLSQTREGIENCYLDDQDVVHVVYRGGAEMSVNVRCDSYTAIIRDVCRRL